MIKKEGAAEMNKQVHSGSPKSILKRKESLDVFYCKG
jgi:hypothetical protein